MADERAEFRIDLSAPGAKEELEAAAKALGYFTRETKDADKEAERTRAGLTRFGQEFQRTSRWIGQATTDQERLARALTTMQHSASISGMKEYSKALEYVDRNLGEVAREAQTAEQALEALQRHAARRGDTDIAASLGGLRGWMDELKPLAAELERPPTRMAAAWGRAAGAVQVAVGNVMAATSQAAAAAVRDFAVTSAQMAIQREALEENLKVILGGEQQMQTAIRMFQGAADQPGVNFQVAADKSLQLMQTGMNLEGAVKTVVEFGNAMAAAGKTEVDTAEGLQQFIQLLIKKKVTLEDLNPLLERSAHFATALEKTYKSFGANTGEEFQKMDVAIGAFAERLVHFLGEGDRAANLTGNAISNLRNEWNEAKVLFGEGLLGDTAQGEIDDLAVSIRNLRPAFEHAGEAAGSFFRMLVEGVKGTIGWFDKFHDLAFVRREISDDAAEKFPGTDWLSMANRWQEINRLEKPLRTRFGWNFGAVSAEANRRRAELEGGFGGLRVAESKMPPASTGEPDYGDDGTGPVKPLDASKMAAEAKRKEIANRDAWIAKLQVAEDIKRKTGRDMPGFKGWSADALLAARLHAEEVQFAAKKDTAGVWKSQQEARDAGTAKRRQELQVQQQLVEADLDLIAINRQEGADRRRSAVEQLVFLDKEFEMRRKLLTLKQAEAALELDPAMEPAQAKQAAVDLAVLEREAADERQKILKAEQDETEKSLRGKVEQANALLDLSRVEEGHGNAVRMKIQALIELERHYNSTGQTIEAMRTKTERLRLEQEKGQRTIAEQILAAGPGAGAISAMLKRQGVNASDLGEPGRGIWQQEATIDPSAFQSKHFRGDAPGLAVDAAAQAIADSIPGAVPNRVKQIAELAASKVLDNVIDGLGRVV